MRTGLEVKEGGRVGVGRVRKGKDGGGKSSAVGGDRGKARA